MNLSLGSFSMRISNKPAMNRLQKFAASLAALLLLVHGKVYATCQYDKPDTPALSVYADTNLAWYPDQQVGTPLSDWSTAYENNVTVVCSPASDVQLSWNRLQATPGSITSYTEDGQTYTVYSTDVPGIGYVLAGAVMTANGLSSWTALNNGGNALFSGNATQAQTRVRMRFILTGTLEPKTYSFPVIPAGLVRVTDNTSGSQLASQTVYLSLASRGLFVIPAPTCSLATSTATFGMGVVAASAFKGMGSNQDWVDDQSLVSGGCNLSTVSMTFAGDAASDGKAFANKGDAQGVALELWQKDGPQVIPNSSTPVTFSAQPAGGKYTFRARYLQTEPTVTPGTVEATVTVTVNYK
jgi:type 1 fimbria pilin